MRKRRGGRQRVRAAVTDPRGTQTADYDYALPTERIAQHPLTPRDASRLMVLERATGGITHRSFRDLPDLVAPGDVLVVNRSRVMRARLLGQRDTGARAEVLLLRELADGSGRFEAMVHPGGKLKPGRTVRVADELTVEIEAVTERRTRIVRLRTPLAVYDAIERHGHVPLPPYIVRPDEDADRDDYQTIFARELGSVAAPTAGLHFTSAVIDALVARGAEVVEIVLHVGAGTFKPVEAEDPAQHVMHEEVYTIDEAASGAIAKARTAGGRVWAVGTTTLRALESACDDAGRVRPGTRETRLFIRPPYRVRAADRLITNFHLPRSTLLMLVAAFAGYDLTMRAYREAIAEGYRFYSYGDAMAIL
jgi:S-adenosylmethionine:tRNA ribosyltransferase-isomerase